MTWPSTPINTTNLDNGADEPRLARADLKNMADAVNAMIDYGDPYDPASPVPIPIAVYTFNFTSASSTIAAGAKRVFQAGDGNMIELFDKIGLSVSGTQGVILPTGTYLLELNLQATADRAGRVQLTNQSGSGLFLSQNLIPVGSNYIAVSTVSSVCNAGTVHIAFENTDSTSGIYTILNGYGATVPDANVFVLKITKIA